ncbi:MAG: VCBS repeat-containing protein [Cellvibrio sp.]|nr:VCBS repeat-containing protein [Cellvibrio sp.]
MVYNNAGVLSAPQSFTLADADLTNKINSGALRLANLGSDIFAVSSGSGQSTILIRGATASTPGLLITSFSSKDLPSASDIRSYSTTNFIGISDRNVQLQITDINGDGLNDVLLTDSSSQYAYLNEFGSGPNRYFEVTASTSLPIADATHVGTTAGQFRVDESGAATYSIPIGLPDGIAGVKPQISLNYSSNAGNGIAGRGWSLGGLSSISRCRQTLSQDNNPQPITWSATDRFCLDGARLILTSGTYGSVGSTYKTEIDSVIEVKAVGGSVGHPNKFEVKAKDGSITTYGGTALSKVLGSSTNPATTILTWSISRFQDNIGNAIDFEYSGDVATGQVIKNIHYAFNTYAQAQAKIEFIYESRTDPSSAYVAGYLFGQTQKLNQIKVYNSSVSPTSTSVLTEVRRYNLNYLPTTTIASDNRGINFISRLESIQECKGAACYAPTQFSWGAGNKLVYDKHITEFNVQSTADTKPILQRTFADVTGDGRQDLIYAVLDSYSANSSTASVAVYVKSQSSITRVYYNSVNRYTFKLQTLDYNGDGRQDLAVYEGSQWKLFLSTPIPSSNVWELKNSNFNISLTNPNTVFADINSDGLADAITNQGYYLLERDGNKPLSSSLYYKFGSFVSLTLHPNNVYAPFQQPFNTNEPNLSSCVIQPTIEFYIQNGGLADFNGDGVTDFIGSVTQSMKCQDSTIVNYDPTVTRTREAIYAFVVQNNQLIQYSTSALSSSYQAMDVNGDGLSDLVTSTTTNNVHAYQYRINNGKGFESATAWHSVTSVKKPQLTDYNGDGYVDIVWSHTTLSAKLWGQDVITIDATPNINGNTDEFAIADVTGDGVGDLIIMSPTAVRAFYGEYVIETGQTQYCYSQPGGQTCTSYPQHVTVGSTRQNLNIVSIVNGTGAITNINYGTLSNSGRYKTMEVNPVLQTGGSPEQCFTGGNGEIAYCSGGYTYSYDLSTFYTKLNGGWDLPSGSFTLVPGNANKDKPVLEVNGSMMVVTAVESNAPAANDSTAYTVNQSAMSKVDYHYGEAKMQASGRGFLGFAKLTTVDAQTNVKTVSFYRQDFPFIGSPISTTVYSDSTATAKILSHSFNNWNVKEKTGADGTKYYLPYLQDSTEKTYDVDNTANTVLQTVATSNIYDDYGNLTNSTATTSGLGTSSTQTVVNTYGSTTDTKLYGRISQAQVSTSRNGSAPVTKTSQFTYYPKDGTYKFLLESAEIVGGLKQLITTINLVIKLKSVLLQKIR